MSKDKKETQAKMVVTITLTERSGRSMGGGFYQNWVEGTDKKSGKVVGIHSGAGLGNPILTFYSEEKGGRRRYFDIDVRDILKLCDKELDSIPSPPSP